MRKWLIFIWMLSSCLSGSPLLAAPLQDHTAIRATALAFAQAETRNLPGEVNIEVSPIDSRLRFESCDKLQAFLPAGAKLIGKTSIGVRCNAHPGWRVFLQADIKVTVDLIVSRRPLTQGTVLSAADLGTQRGLLSRPGLMTSPEQALGQTLKYSIGAGQVLRQDMLRAPLLVRQGQNVTLRARGDGFIVSQQGIALNDAGKGEVVRIRTVTSQVVRGRMVAMGMAEVRP